MSEIKTIDNSEIKGIRELPYQKIKPETDMTVKQAKNTIDSLFANREDTEKTDSETKEYTTYQERFDKTPKIDCDYGNWEGERGESKFVPNDSEVKAKLAEYGQDGIAYKDCKPDFHPVSEATIKIDMTQDRPGYNFPQADKECAKQWNETAKDGRTDWTDKEVRQWRHDHGYTWHECNDMKTCELVPTVIHEKCKHSGGVAECKKRDGVNCVGGGFDE